MSQKLIQKEKLRSDLKPSEILRTTTKQQYRGIYHEPHTNNYCAVGVLITEKFGWDGECITLHKPYEKLEQLLAGHGLNGAKISRINDQSLVSFDDIADFLESRGL